MDLSNSFAVALPIDETWVVLTDIERVAPCLPGAHLQEVHGNDYRGVIRVKIGPISTQYTGSATFIERNDTDHKLVFTGQGLDNDGEGNAEATVTIRLEPTSDTTTQVNVDTDLTLSGRVAQLGKGVFPEVSTTLIDQFAANLAAMLDGNGAAPARLADGSWSERRRVEMPEPEAIDLMEAAGTPVLKRLAGATFIVLVVLWLWKRRR